MAFTSALRKTSLADVNLGGQSAWVAAFQICPVCEQVTLDLLLMQQTVGRSSIEEQHRVWPKGSGRPPVAPEVPLAIAEDYTEACLVINDSPKASAALGRRCLQHILREKAGVKPMDLAKEIQQVLDHGTLPSHLAESIDAVRNVGNFAAHPIKGEHSGEVLPVEPGEAEWTLDVLELLFDFYFVQPARIQEKRAALDAKLAEAGKPPMK